MASRALPSDIEAEMSVLGVSFLNKESLEKISDEVTEDMFYSDKNRTIFKAIINLYKNGDPIDLTTVKAELDKKKSLNEIGGITYLMEVIDSVVTAANLSYYIKILKEHAIRRNLINTATDIVTSAYSDENISGLLDDAERTILNVVRVRQTSEFVPIHEILRRAQERLEELAKSKSDITGIRTGFYDLDKATAGLHGGELIILAARPGMGKTAFALNIATNAAFSTDKAIAIFNLEMSAEMLVNRMIASVGGIDSHKLSTGRLEHNDWKRYNEAMSKLGNTNIFIEDNASITAPEIKAKCRRLASSPSGLGLVVIDYLQLVTTGSNRIESRQVEVSEISRSLKTMALELDVPVIALAQLSRSVDKRENKEPALVDLRESGSLEQDADLVLFLNRKDYYEAKTEKKETIVPIDVIIAKHRKGSTGLYRLLFELNMSNFKNYLSPEFVQENM
ncbi:MAG: replicative DNA helicase [Bacilli bacterium]|jgi:replicative DNA helicase|nr:replicative DNA helicase [Bacilli bacterium]